MKIFKLAAAFAALPMALLAQDATQQAADTSSPAAAIRAHSQSRLTLPDSFSAETRTQLEATLRAARERNLPEEPIRDRISEGQAKGASEAQIVLAARRTEARLEAAQSAIISAGRPQPSEDEVEGGADAMERGATRAQISLLARSTGSDRSLVVAFETLSSLAGSGLPVNTALARVIANAGGEPSGSAGPDRGISASVSGTVRVIR